jgi:ribosomal protein L32
MQQIEAPEVTKCKACGRLVGRDELTHEGCLVCEEVKQYEEIRPDPKIYKDGEEL